MSIPARASPMTALETYVAVKKAQNEARKRVLKEHGVPLSDWAKIRVQAIFEMGEDKAREVGGMKVQVMDKPVYLDRKPEKPLYVEQSLIVSRAR